ncbi:PAS domain S-box protein [Nocardioides sp. MAH-18]|uniref:histidine kinase n=1 Tax=Nocardioides agri TaxID=2682843 RepID=A0A6L6XKK4_9ACTN|nr:MULTISPECIES: PAS domain-containing sensor histidine kinase [unclassified Nocardioides]MBA2956595.1 PAS domain-containing sensor histidine kinase [Nocardioides sp. CGMCC 1.13656]MVQ47739.1 PAS domain S-box protein [Nocardioides sp. MAH-18]
MTTSGLHGVVLGERLGAAVLELFDETDEARLLMGTDRRIVLVNKSCERLFGRSRDELVGGLARVLVPDRLFEDYDHVYRRLMAGEGGGTVSVNLWGVRADGREFPTRVVCRLLSASRDDPLLSIVVLDRTSVDDSAANAFLETVHSGNLVVDGSGRIVMANARAEEMFGYAEEQMVGEPVELLVPTDQRDAHVDLRGAFAARASRHVMNQGNRVVARRRDGAVFPVRVLLTSIGQGADVLVAASVLDVTEIEDLRGESDRLKSQFLANVSHELRTPLTSVIGGAEMLAEEVEAIEDPVLKERLSRYTSMIARGARRQHALVEDLLALTSVDRGEASGAGDLADLMVVVENVVHDYGPAARTAGLTLVADATGLPILVRADERWLNRAVDCLVANAVKFTPAGGTVEVSAGWASGGAWLEVADTGPGIPQEERERIFGRLSRGAAAIAGEVPGAGLGLPIARSVVESCGGQLVVVPPEPGEVGARLRMTLPGLDL